MRTTLTLDDELWRRLRERARRTGRPFKEVVNEALAVGLRDGGAPTASATPTWAGRAPAWTSTGPWPWPTRWPTRPARTSSSAGGDPRRRQRPDLRGQRRPAPARPRAALARSPRVFERPLAVAAALGYVEEWLAQPPVTAVGPGPEHWPTFRRLLAGSGTGANLTTDAHLAALALERGAALCTMDRDLARFPGLRLIHPAGKPKAR